MTTSANSVFDPQRDTIIKTALQLCQVLNAGADPDADQVALGRALLDLGLKALQSDGVVLRHVNRTTVLAAAIVSGVITADSDTADIDSAYWTDTGGNDNPISLDLTRRMYMNLSDKATVGPPSQGYVERSGTSVTLMLYPVPDASAVSVTYAKIRRVRDMDAGDVTLDLPPKWGRCVVYMLAADFALHYGLIDRLAQLQGAYEHEKTRAMNDETERGASRFVVGEYYGRG